MTDERTMPFLGQNIGPIDADNFVLGFTYGTLRPGYHNFMWSEDAVVEHVGAGICQGRLYVSGIPYLDANGDGTVAGDLMRYDTHTDMFWKICQMEISAGYTWRIVEVMLADATLHRAGVWHCDFARNRGKLVASGDYGDYAPVSKRFGTST